MHPLPDLGADDRLGDFAALLAQLERPTESLAVESGYVALMARISSPRFRERHAAVHH